MKSRKGIFFTVTAMLMLTLFLLSYTLFSYSDEKESVQKRVETMNNFVFSVEEDLPRQLFIFGFRTIFLFEKEITERGAYINNLDERVEEAFFNGTVYDVPQELLVGAMFDDIYSSLRTRANKINANITILNPDIEITQDDPWNVKIVLTSNLIIEDLNELVMWDKQSTIVAYVPTENFDDPLYLLNTNGMISNKVKKTPYSDLVVGGDVSNLFDHLKNSYYINSTEAPSFLDRLEGDLNANEFGVESLVDLDELTIVQDKSVVDHIYFSTSDPSACNILPNGMPVWFKLDNAHHSLYEVGGCA